MNESHAQALRYIKNAGGNPKIVHFDEDFEPVGPKLRLEMKGAELVIEEDRRIRAK